jgi:hypothetical protein
MLILDALAESRIREAMVQGAFDDLPGAGRPLALDDDALVASELRAAYRVLKNSGFVPPEVEIRREIARFHALLAVLDDGAERRRALARLALLQARLEPSRARRLSRSRAYEGRLLERLGRQ